MPLSSSGAATTLTATTRYVYHGNDGTSFPWNDTAQLDYLEAACARAGDPDHPSCRAALSDHSLRRGDGAGQAPRPAAVVSAARRRRIDSVARGIRHVAGRNSMRSCRTSSGAKWWIASPPRSPERCCWPRPSGCMEGYFVRTLGMHRVYNSAFMNMLRDEENAKYRSVI